MSVLIGCVRGGVEVVESQERSHSYAYHGLRAIALLAACPFRASYDLDDKHIVITAHPTFTLMRDKVPGQCYGIAAYIPEDVQIEVSEVQA